MNSLNLIKNKVVIKTHSCAAPTQTVTANAMKRPVKNIKAQIRSMTIAAYFHSSSYSEVLSSSRIRSKWNSIWVDHINTWCRFKCLFGNSYLPDINLSSSKIDRISLFGNSFGFSFIGEACLESEALFGAVWRQRIFGPIRFKHRSHEGKACWPTMWWSRKQ